MTDVRSKNRDLLALKAENTYCLVFYRRSLPTLLRSLFLNTGYILQSPRKISESECPGPTHTDSDLTGLNPECQDFVCLMMMSLFFFFLIIEVQFTPCKNIHLKRNNSQLPKATTLFRAKLLKLSTLPAKLLSSVFLISTLKASYLPLNWSCSFQVINSFTIAKLQLFLLSYQIYLYHFK